MKKKNRSSLDVAAVEESWRTRTKVVGDGFRRRWEELKVTAGVGGEIVAAAT